MNAAAILAAPAVNVENKPPADPVAVTGDFKAVLQQQVDGQNSGTAVSDSTQQENLAVTQTEISVLPAVDGLKELMEMLQELLAAAGYTQGTEAVTAEGDTEAITEDTEGKTILLDADENSASADNTAAVEMLAVIQMAAANGMNTNAGLESVGVDTDAEVTATGDTGSAVNAQNGAANAAQLPAEILAVLQSISPMLTGNPVNAVRSLQLPGEANQKLFTELNQKLSVLVSKFAAGENITGELEALVKNFGLASVTKEIRKMLAGLTGSGIEAADKFKQVISAAAGNNLVISVEKAAVKVTDTPVEKGMEPEGPPVQVTRGSNTSGMLSQNAGQGTGETGNVPQQMTNTEPTSRFVIQQPTETVKAPVNSFARWTEDILGKIGEKAKLIIGSGQSEMQIQLKPEFLGKINLQVTMENGQLTARIGVESMQVKELVEANLKQLQQNLDNQGIKVSNLAVDLSANRNFQQFNRPQDFGTGKPLRYMANSNDEGYGSLSAENRIAPDRWGDMYSTVDYIA